MDTQGCADHCQDPNKTDINCPNQQDFELLGNRFSFMVWVSTITLAGALFGVGFFYWKNMTVLSEIGIETKQIVCQLNEQKRINIQVAAEVSSLSTRLTVIESKVLSGNTEK